MHDTPHPDFLLPVMCKKKKKKNPVQLTTLQPWLIVVVTVLLRCQSIKDYDSCSADTGEKSGAYNCGPFPHFF